jgi:hypothetical protein
MIGQEFKSWWYLLIVAGSSVFKNGFSWWAVLGIGAALLFIIGSGSRPLLAVFLFNRRLKPSPSIPVYSSKKCATFLIPIFKLSAINSGSSYSHSAWKP